MASPVKHSKPSSPTPLGARALSLPADWAEALGEELDKPYFSELCAFLEKERASHPVFPAEPDLFRALALTPLAQTRVVVVGQDPYHGPGQAHGLAFSVLPGVPPPPSLANIFRELEQDLGHPRPSNGSLVPWARQGVLLLNTVLTVRAGSPHSHRRQGWEHFTDAVFRVLRDQPRPLIFVLWGKPAQEKARWLEGTAHVVLKGPHPSPLSAHSGFFGSRPFSQINRLLESRGEPPIDWRLS